MALDFHDAHTQDYLFSLDDQQFGHLLDVFEILKKHTGVSIDYYENIKLSLVGQVTLLNIIDQYLERLDFELNKEKTQSIIVFKALLQHFTSKTTTIALYCD